MESSESGKPVRPSGGVLRYAVVIERGATSYSAYLPDLHGCIAAAETEEEVEQLIREAIEFHLECMRDDGEPIPEPTSRIIYVDVASEAV
jgi:predicted RNase H-like HicB family nuclease